MAQFKNLDKIKKDNPGRYFIYEGEKYHLSTISVGTLSDLNQIAQDGMQDIPKLMGLLVEAFPKLSMETCRGFEPDQFAAIIQLVVGSFEEVAEGDSEGGKKDQTESISTDQEI